MGGELVKNFIGKAETYWYRASEETGNRPMSSKPTASLVICPRLCSVWFIRILRLTMLLTLNVASCPLFRKEESASGQRNHWRLFTLSTRTALVHRPTNPVIVGFAMMGDAALHTTPKQSRLSSSVLRAKSSKNQWCQSAPVCVIKTALRITLSFNSWIQCSMERKYKILFILSDLECTNSFI